VGLKGQALCLCVIAVFGLHAGYGLTVGSPAFVDGGRLPEVYAEAVSEVSPPICVSAVPPRARTLVVIADRPKAGGEPVIHWIVFNVSSTEKDLPEDVVFPETNSPFAPSFGLNSWAKDRWVGARLRRDAGPVRIRVFAIDGYLMFESPPDLERLTDAMEERVLDVGEVWASVD